MVQIIDKIQVKQKIINKKCKLIKRSLPSHSRRKLIDKMSNECEIKEKNLQSLPTMYLLISFEIRGVNNNFYSGYQLI